MNLARNLGKRSTTWTQRDPDQHRSMPCPRANAPLLDGGRVSDVPDVH